MDTDSALSQGNHLLILGCGNFRENSPGGAGGAEGPRKEWGGQGQLCPWEDLEEETLLKGQTQLQGAVREKEDT